MNPMELSMRCALAHLNIGAVRALMLWLGRPLTGGVV